RSAHRTRFSFSRPLFRYRHREPREQRLGNLAHRELRAEPVANATGWRLPGRLFPRLSDARHGNHRIAVAASRKELPRLESRADDPLSLGISVFFPDPLAYARTKSAIGCDRGTHGDVACEHHLH